MAMKYDLIIDGRRYHSQDDSAASASDVLASLEQRAKRGRDGWFSLRTGQDDDRVLVNWNRATTIQVILTPEAPVSGQVIADAHQSGAADGD